MSSFVNTRIKRNPAAYSTTIFVVYIICLLKITVVRNGIRYETLFSGTLNLLPFKNLAALYQNAGLFKFIYLFGGNIVWFIPFGFLLPFISKKPNHSRIVMYGFALSLAIELAQFGFGTGISEVDDLILNTLGASIGYLLHRVWLKKFASGS